MTREFRFALLATVLATSTFAPAQNSRSPHKASAVAKPATASLTAQSAAAALSAGTSSQPQALASPLKACDSDEQKAKLRGAQFDFDNLRFPNAASQFSALITSCDQSVRAQAETLFDQANAKMSTWWWIEGRYLPPLRWYHHPGFWEAVGRTLLILGVILVVLWPFFYLTDLHAFQRVTAPFAVFQQKMRTFFLVDRLPRASIMTPFSLTDDTKDHLFSSKLENSSHDVRRVLERAGGGLQVRATALLALPSETTSKLVECLPKVRGVDVAGIAKFLFYLKRYLGWRVESEVGYCPPTKASDGSESPARVVASASLRHAFWVRGGPWPVERPVQHAYDVDGVAFAIAARIMGFNMRPTVTDNNVSDGLLPFTDEESFGLFIEGLRSLQQYEDEAARQRPLKTELGRTMHSALTCFRQGTSRYPDDLLSAFYLGVALSMKNQEVYVDRLVELKTELMAFGRFLEFEDVAKTLSAAIDTKAGEDKKEELKNKQELVKDHAGEREAHAHPADADIHIKKRMKENKEFATRRAKEEKTSAQPFLDLAKRPWPLLEAASRLFKSLTESDASAELKLVASYNLAQVLARRGSKDAQKHLKDALDVIHKSTLPTVHHLTATAAALKAQYTALRQPPKNAKPRPSPSALNAREPLEDLRRKIHSVYETMALVIQFEALRETLNLRIAAFHKGTNVEPAVAAVKAVEKSIEDTQLFDPGFKADLLADYLTKTGYGKYESAFNHELHLAVPGDPSIAKAMGFPDGSSPSARFFLDKAAQDFTLALELKEYWNPAQIYLALVRRIQAGMAEARTELLKHDRDLALAPYTKQKADAEAELEKLSARKARAETAKDTDERLRLTDEESGQLKKKKESEAKLDKKGSGFDRQIAGSDGEKQRFCREADELFAALQGIPSSTPTTISAPAATTPSSLAQTPTPDSPKAVAS